PHSLSLSSHPRTLHSFPTRRSSDLSPNASTSSTKTAYLFSATDHIEKNISLLLDYVQEPYFSDESVEKEKGIIVQELKMYQDNPDRKSTRLNSSHVSISYAVFCLKK